MKVKRKIFLSFATLIVIVLGLFLPNIAYISQSGGIPSSSRQYSVDTIQLETSNSDSLSDTLRLMSGEHEFITIEEGNKLNEEEAYQSVFTFLAFLEEHGVAFDSKAYTAHSETPVLIFTEDGGNAAVIWECVLANPDGGSTISVQLDDATGRILAFIYVGYKNLTQNTNTAVTMLSADDWGKICVEYYGFKSFESKTLIQENSEQEYALVFTDSDGEELTLPYRTDYDTAQDDSAEAIINFNFSQIIS